jgi:hypothetical protein
MSFAGWAVVLAVVLGLLAAGLVCAVRIYLALTVDSEPEDAVRRSTSAAAVRRHRGV